MVATRSLQPAQFSLEEDLRTDWRLWLLFLLLALLGHVLFLISQPGFEATHLPPRVQVQEIDQKKVEAIRRKWREQNKQILLNRNQPKSDVAPDVARFESEHNIRVEKEQRAKKTNVIPQPEQKAQEQGEKAKPQMNRMQDLSRLGVPLHLAERAKLGAEAKERKQAQEGGDQTILEDLPEGGENMLNAQESVYYSFYARLYEAIGPIWQSEVRGTRFTHIVRQGDYVTQVDVILDQHGGLVLVHQLQSSGVKEFDDAVQKAWRKVGRFPNPPSGLIKEDGQVHMAWGFTVRMTNDMSFDYIPPPNP